MLEPDSWKPLNAYDRGGASHSLGAGSSDFKIFGMAHEVRRRKFQPTHG